MGLAAVILAGSLLGGCSRAQLITGGPLPSPSPLTPKITNEFTVPTSGSGPSGISLGVGGYNYFTEATSGKVGSMSIGGAFAEYTISSSGGTAGNQPIGIVQGPDNNEWFTEDGAKPGLAAFNTSTHTLVEYPIGGTSAPAYITRGPLVNSLVFTDPGNHAIGLALTSNEYFGPGGLTPPAGCVTAASANICEQPVSGSMPLGLVVQSTTSLVYVAEYDVSKIAVWNTTTGALTEISTPTANAGPAFVVQGNEGDIWFTEDNAVQLGRLFVSSNTISESSLSPAKSATGIILAQSNFYFLDPVSNQVGRVSPTTLSSVTEFAIPTANALSNAAPFHTSMTFGNDGLIYFTEFNSGKIAQFEY
jgi:streptogramin lyase